MLFYQSGRRSRHPRAPSTGKASTLSCEFLLFSRTNSRALGNPFDFLAGMSHTPTPQGDRLAALAESRTLRDALPTRRQSGPLMPVVSPLAASEPATRCDKQTRRCPRRGGRRPQSMRRHCVQEVVPSVTSACRIGKESRVFRNDQGSSSSIGVAVIYRGWPSRQQPRLSEQSTELGVDDSAYHLRSPKPSQGGPECFGPQSSWIQRFD